MIAKPTVLSRNSTLSLNYKGSLPSDTCCDPSSFCCVECCESVRQDFNSRHPRGSTGCVYVLILSAPLPPSAVHACCSCCSYARNLHSPVHCSACLCHHSGSKGANVHVAALFCSLSLADTRLWLWPNLLAGNKALKIQPDTIIRRILYVWSMTNCSFNNVPILEREQEMKKNCQKLKIYQVRLSG